MIQARFSKQAKVNLADERTEIDDGHSRNRRPDAKESGVGRLGRANMLENVHRW